MKTKNSNSKKAKEIWEAQVSLSSTQEKDAKYWEKFFNLKLSELKDYFKDIDPIKLTDLCSTTTIKDINPTKKKDLCSTTTIKDIAIGQQIREKLRVHLKKIQKGRCCYCSRKIQSQSAEIEHIVPKSIYPTFCFKYQNLALICSDCNGIKTKDDWWNPPNKKTTDYISASSNLSFFHPRFHNYNAHVFHLLIDSTLGGLIVYQGVTPQGKHLCNNLLGKVSAKDIYLNGNIKLKADINVIMKSDKTNTPELTKFLATLQEKMLSFLPT